MHTGTALLTLRTQLASCSSFSMAACDTALVRMELMNACSSVAIQSRRPLQCAPAGSGLQ